MPNASAAISQAETDRAWQNVYAGIVDMLSADLSEVTPVSPVTPEELHITRPSAITTAE